MKLPLTRLTIVIFLLGSNMLLGNTPSIHFPSDVPAIQFAVNDLTQALKVKGHHPTNASLSTITNASENIQFVLGLQSDPILQQQLRSITSDDLPQLGKEGYAIRVTHNNDSPTIWAIGADATGAMYAGLSLAETITLNGIDAIRDTTNQPYLEKRGIKFNIPLDGRLPAYSDAGSAAQHNIPHVWDFDFWKHYLDTLARYRYNTISLWNMHPFPSLVKVPDYPEVALDDVMRANLSHEEWIAFNKDFKLPGRNMVNETILNNLEVIKSITIEEKIEFWRKVMAYAQTRGIEFHIITWNVFTWGATGKYGITQDATNPITKDYIRKSITALFDTYPLLAGIGVTAGENMHGIEKDQKEEWLWEAYGLGVMDYLDKNPERQIRFIHRYWWADLNEIVDKFDPLIKRDVTFDISFKYAKARLFSGTKPPFSQEVFKQLPEGTRMWTNLRNDDIYIMRWGDPDYVRDYIHNIPGPDKCPGFYMGSDGYVFAREFISKHPSTSGVLEAEKHWYNFMLWGRLAYDPTLDNEFFKKKVDTHFDLKADSQLFNSWQSASEIIPLVNQFYWNDWDFQWYVESGTGRWDIRDGHSIQSFIDQGTTMEGSGLINIKDYCQQTLTSETTSGSTPLDVAKKLDEIAHRTLKTLPNTPSPNQELKETLNDIEAMAHLGHYYADKIRGAVNLCFFQETGESEYQNKSVTNLESALAHWKRYAAIIDSNYKPQLGSRLRWIDMQELTENIQKDIEIAKK